MRSPEHFQAGLWNAAVFGRNATFTLQNLRSAVKNFDDWYGPKQSAMKADPVMTYFVEYRNKIEKSVADSTTASASLSFSTEELRKAMGRPPPNAKSFFIGDQFGGNGWEVVMPDGSIEKIYVDLPKEIASTKAHLPAAPGDADRSANELVDEYLTKLEALAKEARSTFL